MPIRKKQSSEAAARDIRRKTRRRFSAEKKIRIVLDGLRSEVSVAEMLDVALALTEVHSVRVRHRPRLRSDNGPAYASKDLGDYLEEQGMTHTRGRPYHPQTQGKVERYHRSMKNVVKLQHYRFPWELEAAVRNFVAYYNNRRYHESLDNRTPTDVYYGRHHEVLSERDKLKKLTMQRRKKEYRAANAA